MAPVPMLTQPAVWQKRSTCRGHGRRAHGAKSKRKYKPQLAEVDPAPAYSRALLVPHPKSSAVCETAVCDVPSLVVRRRNASRRLRAERRNPPAAPSREKVLRGGGDMQLGLRSELGSRLFAEAIREAACCDVEGSHRNDPASVLRGRGDRRRLGEHARADAGSRRQHRDASSLPCRTRSDVTLSNEQPEKEALIPARLLEFWTATAPPSSLAYALRKSQPVNVTVGVSSRTIAPCCRGSGAGAGVSAERRGSAVSRALHFTAAGQTGEGLHNPGRRRARRPSRSSGTPRSLGLRTAGSGP